MRAQPLRLKITEKRKMATVSDLNIRLGLIYKDLEKGLDKVERRLRASGRRFSELGDQMTTAFSIPMAAFGATAVTAAGDVQSLQLALEGQLHSAAAAAKEVEALRKSALAPGLGFEQAVKGSVSLQAVNFSAGRARETIEQFGNALALAGKGGAELDGTILALTQIKAKGVVSAEEINQIAERLPQIRTLMQQAFGTASTEEIQKLGITADAFIGGIVEQMKNLPRAAGGIKNALENLWDGLKQSVAKVGFAIDKAFDIAKQSERFTAFISAAADSFASLSPGVQEFIVKFGLLVVAIGPAIKVMGVFKSAGAQVIAALSSLAGGARTAIGVMLSLESAMVRVKLAMGVVGLVIGLATAVYALSDNFDAAQFAASKFSDAQQEIIQQTSSEIGAVNQNFAALKNETLSRVERGKAVDALLKQYPTYFKGMDLEHASIQQLEAAQKGLNAEILRGVAERQKANAVTALYEKQAQILLRIQQLKETGKATASEASLIVSWDAVRAGSISAAVIEKLQEQSAELGNQIGVVSGQFDRAFGTITRSIDASLESEYKARDAYYEARDAQMERVAAIKAEDSAHGASKQITAATKRLSVYKEVLSDIRNVTSQQDLLGAEKISEQGVAIERGMRRLLDEGFSPVSKQVTALKEQMQGLFTGLPIQNFAPLQTLAPQPVASERPDNTKNPFQTVETTLSKYQAIAVQIQDIQDSIQKGDADWTDTMKKSMQVLQDKGDTMGQIYLAMGEAMSSAALSGEQSFQKIGLAAVGAAAKIVRAYIQQGVAAAVSRALSSLPFPLNIAAGAAAGGLAAALFTRGLSRIGVPALASGGLATAPTLAMVGDNVNARVDPEVIAPLSKLRGMLNQAPVIVGGTVRFDGRDLYLMIEQQGIKAKRTRG